eukprot:38549-Eustigmatos_ZCMA.PRE.1
MFEAYGHLEDIRDDAHSYLQQSQHQAAKRYGENRKPVELKPGQQVLLLRTQVARGPKKLHLKWQEQPWTILDAWQHDSFLITRGNQTRLANASHLKPYIRATSELRERLQAEEGEERVQPGKEQGARGAGQEAQKQK